MYTFKYMYTRRCDNKTKDNLCFYNKKVNFIYLLELFPEVLMCSMVVRKFLEKHSL